MKSSIHYIYSSLLIPLLVTTTGQAELLDDGRTHEITATFASLEIRDGMTPTSVNVASPGKVSHLTAYDNSIVRNIDGNIPHARLHDSSVFLAEGGSVSHLHVATASEAALSGGIIDHSVAYDTGRISIRGDGHYHFVSALGTLESRGSESADAPSQVDIFAGNVGITKAKAGGVVNIHGGSIHSVDQAAGGTFNIYGGSIRHISLDRNSVTNIYGQELELSVSGFIRDSPVYLLSGFLADGAEAKAEVFHFHSVGSLNLINVPEPSSLVLFALAGTALLALQRACWRQTNVSGTKPESCSRVARLDA